MTDQAYLERRAAQEVELASNATNRRAAAAHDAMAAVYLSQIAAFAQSEERRLTLQRPPQFWGGPKARCRVLPKGDYMLRAVRTNMSFLPEADGMDGSNGIW